ncbi:MAG: aminotransferase class IV [Lachnospiraceae bacterium]
MQNKTEEKKSSGSTVLADDGFYFGIGAFETIAVEEGIPQLLAWHLERLRDSLAFFGIDQSVEEQEVLAYLSACPQSEEKQHGALKITVTAQNKLFGLRKNTYSEEQYQKGFRLGFSEIRRNETSPLTYHKTLGIADNIMEKRNAKKSGLDEKIFLNQKGQISEGCTTNIFFIQDDKLVTPPVSSGMLPGVMRRYVIKEAGRREYFWKKKNCIRRISVSLTDAL